jgi:hypothetical protein
VTLQGLVDCFKKSVNYSRNVNREEEHPRSMFSKTMWKRIGNEDVIWKLFPHRDIITWFTYVPCVMYAVELGYLKLLQVLLLHCKTDGKFTSEDYKSTITDAITFACTLGNAKAVKILLQNGADANTLVYNGLSLAKHTVLHGYFRAKLTSNYVEVIHVLLEHGADVQDDKECKETFSYNASL